MAVVIKTKNLAALMTEYGVPMDLIQKLNALDTAWAKGPSLKLIIKGQEHWMATPLASCSAGDLILYIQKVLVMHQQHKLGPVGEDEEGTPAAPLPNDKAIPLRHAKVLHQRVIGTSPGSVYVVVAISKKRNVKVAAKIEGMALSVRVEGDGLSDAGTVVRFTEQGLNLKKSSEGLQYMSCHYSCDSDSPPYKVLGAVLLGSDIEFDTNMPSSLSVLSGSA